jgi:hypothetical protein
LRRQESPSLLRAERELALLEAPEQARVLPSRPERVLPNPRVARS